MKVATSFLTILATLAVVVARHPSRGKPALMARHIQAVRDIEEHSAVGRGHTKAHVYRKCEPRSTTGAVLFVSLPVVQTSVSTLVDPSLHAPMTASIPVTTQSVSSLAIGLSVANISPVDNLVGVVSAGSCGPSGATEEITALSGPNGNIDFLNCGLTSGGWTPPLIHTDDVVGVQLSQVAYNPGTVFSACKDFIPLFEKYGYQYGVPAIMLASFAMQESSCISTTVGGAGEQGLMQITPDKCGGAPGGNCQDPEFNVHTGAQFFSQTLDAVNGDLLLAIGQYNGWYRGLTYAQATAAAQNGNCREQNNLDYLHQFLNGWMQDIDPNESDPPLGKYFNLNVCSD